MPDTQLKRLETEQEIEEALANNGDVMICRGRMGPGCIPVYGIVKTSVSMPDSPDDIKGETLEQRANRKITSDGDALISTEKTGSGCRGVIARGTRERRS